MKRVIQKITQADLIYKHLFALVAAIYLMNFAILCFYATGNPITRINNEWYWAQKFFLYSPIYCFLFSVIIGVVSYWRLWDVLKAGEQFNEKDFDPNQVARWMVYASAFFSIGIIYFSISFWLL